MLSKSSGARRGITLVELLVVMIIMVILATVVVAFAPGFQDAQKVGRGSDQLQGWLLMARQWAKKDRLPTGIRLNVTNVSGVAAVTDMQYIQQPSTYIVPYAVPAQAPGQQPLARRISIAANAGGTCTAALDMSWAASPQVEQGRQQGIFSGGVRVRIAPPRGPCNSEIIWFFTKRCIRLQVLGVQFRHLRSANTGKRASNGHYNHSRNHRLLFRSWRATAQR